MQITQPTQHELKPAQVEGKLRELVRRGEQLLTDYTDQAHQAAKAEAEYKIAHAAVLVEAEGAADVRKAKATLATGDLLMRHKVTDALADATRQALFANGKHLSAVQSIGATLRTEFGTSGIGGVT